MIVLSHSTGNENVRQAALAFSEANLLGEFWTTLNWNQRGMLHRILPFTIRETLARRSFPDSVRACTHTVPAREIVRLLTGTLTIDQVSGALDKKVAARLRDLPACDLVYAYEDMALHSFRAAAAQGIARIYDLPIGYWRAGQKIFAEECEREPEWASTLTGTRDSAEKLQRKDEELRLANHVIVASTFTQETLSSASFNAQVDVIPYGAPASISAEPKRISGKLRVLFAGGLGQRKGLSYLLEAVRLLDDSVELTLLGRKTSLDCRPLESAVRKYCWLPSLTHQAVLEEMARQDVLVFPSLFEGFGLVILEAMAQGMTVITTSHTAGPDLIEEGVDGFIVPIRSAEAIAEKLLLLARDRDRLAAMQQAARRKAISHTWENYRRRMVEVARDVMDKPGASE
ncbi:MAG: glycosyltransferase family 4 protein [Verrucomicrobiota bacterium]